MYTFKHVCVYTYNKSIHGVVSKSIGIRISHGIPHISHGIPHISIGIAHISHGIAHTSHTSHGISHKSHTSHGIAHTSHGIAHKSNASHGIPHTSHGLSTQYAVSHATFVCLYTRSFKSTHGLVSSRTFQGEISRSRKQPRDRRRLYVSHCPHPSSACSRRLRRSLCSSLEHYPREYLCAYILKCKHVQ